MSDRIGLAEALFGLGGFRVLEVTENVEELVIAIETRRRTSTLSSSTA